MMTSVVLVPGVDGSNPHSCLIFTISIFLTSQQQNRRI